MFEKKKGLSDLEKQAKMKALKEAHKSMSDLMAGDLKGMKKVTVASNSKEGLQEGLDKAEEVLGEQDDDDMEMSEKEELKQDDLEDNQEESEPMDEDELNAEIEKLLKLKEKLQK